MASPEWMWPLGEDGIWMATYCSPNRVLGRIAAVLLRGISLALSGSMFSLISVPWPLVFTVLTVPTIRPRTLTSEPGTSWLPVTGGAKLTLTLRVNALLYTAIDNADETEQDGDEGQAHEPAPHRHHDCLARHRYPASRTDVVEPQMARDRNRSKTLTATMAVRTARPTAIPTPAGPPLAV